MGPDSQAGFSPARETSASVALVHTMGSRTSTVTLVGLSPASPISTSASANAAVAGAKRRHAVRTMRASRRRMAGSVAAASDATRNHDPEGSNQDLQVENGRPVHEVLQVVAELVLGVGVVATVDLGESRDTRRNLVPA